MSAVVPGVVDRMPRLEVGTWLLGLPLRSKMPSNKQACADPQLIRGHRRRYHKLWRALEAARWVSSGTRLVNATVHEVALVCLGGRGVQCTLRSADAIRIRACGRRHRTAEGPARAGSG